METQRISAKHQRTLFNSVSAILLACALLVPAAQASTATAESLLPPTTQQMLQQTVKQTPSQQEQKENKALTHSEIVDQATSQSADAHVITKNKDGSVRIPSPMQDVIATLTAKGASIYSDDKAGESFALLVNGLGRDKGKLTKIKPGKVSHDEKIARLFRKNLIEEFSTSSAGIRQDFVVPTAPKGKGKLVVELDIEGATVSKDSNGAMLTLKSGRELAYHNLLVADAAGKTLPAHFVVKDKQTLHIVVDDKDATYPVRIDPTITDADWFSMGAAYPGPAGDVHATVSDDAGNLYMGGAFYTLTGIANTAYIAKWDGSNWSALGTGMDDDVLALTWDGSNLYAGGRFTTAGGIAVNGIAMWDGSNWSALDTGVAGMNDTVFALAWDGTNLYAGGSFTTAGSVAVNSIAMWDGSNWSALGSGIAGTIYALAWDGANLYAGGGFTTAGGIAVNHIAMWDGSNWSALGAGVAGQNPKVYALAWDGTNLYAGGWFFTAGGVAANHIAQWDGSAWSALGSGVDSSSSTPYVYALAWDGANLYAGGGFTTAGDVDAYKIAQWDGSSWSALDSGLSVGIPLGPASSVYALAFDGTKLYAGGYFSRAGDVPAYRFAQWDGSTWARVGSGMNGSVNALVSDGSNLYIGGDFTSIGDIIVDHITKWDGSNWSALDSGMGGPFHEVRALAWDGTNLYAAGLFHNAGGVVAEFIAKWDGTSWSALDYGMDADINALVWDGSNLYAGGYFTNAGYASANYVAKWNGSSWSALGSGMNGPVHALASDGTNLYAGGNFTSAGGVSTNYIAKWDGSSWSALGSGMNSSVGALASDGTNLYAGGSFSSAGGVSAHHVAKWDGSVWSALGSGMGGIPHVGALIWNGSTLYAGGEFTTAGGVSANNIAQWDGTTWSALGSGTNDRVMALNWDGINLYVGGWFTNAGGKAAGYVAGIPLDSTTPDPLTFTDVTNAALDSDITSNIQNITGINTGVDITITGGEYSLNSGDFTSVAGTANNGDSLQLRTTSSVDYNTPVDVVVTVGDGGNVTWRVTTLTDIVPDAFSFVDQADLATNVTATSNTVTITGLGSTSQVSITNGQYSINGGGYTSTSGFINNNDTITVRHTSSDLANTAVDTVLDIGGVSDTFTTTTGAVDTTPNPFNFFDRVDAQLNTSYNSTNSIQVSGINTDASISVIGGEYSIDGGTWTSSPGTVSAFSRVLLRQTSANTGTTQTNTVLTIGGVSATFSTTTKVTDTTPNPFNFYDRTGAQLNTLYYSTNSIQVSGTTADAPISVTGGEYSIDGGVWTSAPGTVSVFSRVLLRQTSADTGTTQTNTVLTIGGVSATFSTTTKVTDTAPNPFNFYDRTGAKLNTLYNSTNSIGVSGINADAPISVTGGEYSIDGGAWTSAPGAVSVFSRVLLRQTSASTGSTQTDTVLTIGGVSATFSITTKAAPAPDTTPNQFSYYDRTGAQLNRLYNSTNSIQVSGITADAPIFVTGGEYSIDGGAWTSAPGTVSVLSRVLLRQTSAETNNTQTDTVLTIGGISATFSITTKL